jgi:Transmembrane proteins 230/134
MYEQKPKYNFEIQDAEINEEEIKIEYVGSQSFPKIPVRPFVAALLLLITGVVLTILGFVEEFTNFKEPSRGIAFWVLGGITLIPGGYFTLQFYRAFRAKTPAERMNILRNIPEIE